MGLLSKLELLGFYWCENNTCKEIPSSEVFPIAYDFVIDIAINNVYEDLRNSSRENKIFLMVPKEKYEELRKEVKNKMVARFRLDDKIISFKVILRKDDKITSKIIVKPPAALLLFNENIGYIVLREARFYSKAFYKGNFVITKKEDLNKNVLGVIQEPLIISLPEVINLDLKVITEPYTSSIRIVESAVLYIRKFYPLVLSQLRDIDIEEIKILLKRFIVKTYKYGVVFSDFDLDQIAVGTIDNSKGVIVTDPEFAYFCANPKKIIRYLWYGYLSIIGSKNILELLKIKDFNVGFTIKRLGEVLEKYNKGNYKNYINALYQSSRNREGNN